ncbi:ImmA/IrrE family metallo-endopeptidase [Georgenia sp. AZ-5]|uniref:ImmA/IrrE family metallo-endopeptidase n=1 Tax=Georgenia sp. AZ-5 TaxID=3367526 RepID=UPI00375540C7
MRDDDPFDMPRWPVASIPEAAAEELRRWVGVSDADQASWRDDYEALRAWRDAFDQCGILVFALEIGRDDVRGFSAWDDRAPLIVANTSGVSPAARSYTLAHELGHLVTRQDAACVEQRGFLTGAAVERWCERFGAAFLMPSQPMERLASARNITAGAGDIDDVKAVAKAFRVSHRAAALRLIDMGLAERSLYADVLAIFRPKPPAKPSNSFRRPARATARVREFGPRALDIVLNELPPRDALSVLRVTVEDVRRISEEVPSVQTSF